jgi:hypothetical protein
MILTRVQDFEMRVRPLPTVARCQTLSFLPNKVWPAPVFLQHL